MCQLQETNQFPLQSPTVPTVPSINSKKITITEKSISMDYTNAPLLIITNHTAKDTRVVHTHAQYTEVRANPSHFSMFCEFLMNSLKSKQMITQ